MKIWLVAHLRRDREEDERHELAEQLERDEGEQQQSPSTRVQRRAAAARAAAAQRPRRRRRQPSPWNEKLSVK